MEDFRIKRGDTLPEFLASLTERDPDQTDPNARRPLDLTAVDTVRLLGKTRNNKRALNGECEVVNADPADPIWEDFPGVTPYPYKVRYQWQSADTDTAAILIGEIELTFTGGGIQTVPARGYFQIVIEGDQGP